MRAGLVITGIVLFLVAAVLYIAPLIMRTSGVTLVIPWVLTLAVLVLGLLALLLGIVLPSEDQRPVREVHTVERVVTGDGAARRVVRERREDREDDEYRPR